MAKKPYDVAERFQEVARRARETGPIHTGPKVHSSTVRPFKKSPLEDKSEESQYAYYSRPGKAHTLTQLEKRMKDVNLPIETASPEVKKRLYGKK